MQRTDDAENAASLDTLLADKFYAGYTVGEAIERLAAHRFIVKSRVRNQIYERLAAFLRTIDDLKTDMANLKRESTVVPGVKFTADADALLRRPGALTTFKALATQPCVRGVFPEDDPSWTDAVLERCVHARFIELRLPDAIALHAANTEANARAASPDHDMQHALNEADLDNILRALLKEGQPESDTCYLFGCNVFKEWSRDGVSPCVTPAMSGKTVLLVPFCIATGRARLNTRWDLAVVVRTSPDMADVHIFGPRRNRVQEVVTKMEAFARVILGPCHLRPTHMPLTRRVAAPEHHIAYMASNLRAFLSACQAHFNGSGVLNVGWIHDFAPSRDYDDIAAMHAFARALKTQATQPAEDAGAIQELSVSAGSSPASVEEAEPSGSKRKANNESPSSKTTSKKTKQ